MEPNGFHGGLFSGIGSGIVGLEMPLHPQPQNPQNSHNPQDQQNPLHLNLHHPQMVSYAQHLDTDHHHSTQTHQSVKPSSHVYLFTSKEQQQRQQHSPLSDDDELGLAPDDNAGGDGKRKVSPWQRMKWTDNMVRLLIMAVFYIGDEAGISSEGNDKKKGGALLQKKGKWKSISRAMMEKGFCVSPQQCEDKFNDLNKRYKRVNEILGKGTACHVVENQSLLDTMDLPPKLKEEVKKLLNSKHLFFREMCAYHTSCGHAGGGSGGSGGPSGANHSPEIATEPSQIQQQICSHSSENVQTGANSSRNEKVGSEEEDDVDEEDDYDDEDEDDDRDDDDDDAIEGNSRGQNGHGHRHRHDDEDDNDKPPHKRPRNGVLTVSLSPLMQQLSSEVSGVIHDGAKSGWEKQQWMKNRLLELEEQRVSYQFQALELEKQRLKWVKFSSKKEREMERAKLEIERRRLENERMLLVVRQKERELIDDLHHHHQHQHSSN